MQVDLTVEQKKLLIESLKMRPYAEVCDVIQKLEMGEVDNTT